MSARNRLDTRVLALWARDATGKIEKISPCRSHCFHTWQMARVTPEERSKEGINNIMPGIL